MRWGIFYAGVFSATLAAAVAVQYHWVPPLIAVWDSRAYLYFYRFCLALALIGAIGVASQTPWQRLPRSIRFIPLGSALFITGFLALAILDLSPSTGLAEAATNLGLAVAEGFGLAIVMGLLSSLSPEEPGEKAALQRPPQTIAVYLLIALGVACVVAGVIFLTPRARDDISIREFDRFTKSNSQLVIGTSAGAGADDTFGVIRIANRSNVNSLVLKRSEWKTS